MDDDGPGTAAVARPPRSPSADGPGGYSGGGYSAPNLRGGADVASLGTGSAFAQNEDVDVELMHTPSRNSLDSPARLNSASAEGPLGFQQSGGRPEGLPAEAAQRRDGSGSVSPTGSAATPIIPDISTRPHSETNRGAAQANTAAPSPNTVAAAAAAPRAASGQQPQPQQQQAGNDGGNDGRQQRRRRRNNNNDAPNNNNGGNDAAEGNANAAPAGTGGSSSGPQGGQGGPAERPRVPNSEIYARARVALPDGDRLAVKRAIFLDAEWLEPLCCGGRCSLRRQFCLRCEVAGLWNLYYDPEEDCCEPLARRPSALTGLIVALDVLSGGCPCGPFYHGLGTACFGCWARWMVRRRYHIVGFGYTDCCATLAMPGLVMAQCEYEMEHNLIDPPTVARPMV